MSQGSVWIDGRIWVNPSESGFAGSQFVISNQFVKDWDGKDTEKPSELHSLETVWLTQHARPRVVFNRRTGGYRTVRDAPIRYSVLRRKRVTPKRTKQSQNNSYTMNLYHSSDVQLIVRQFPTQDPPTLSSFTAWYSEPSATRSWDSNDDIELLQRARQYVAGSDFNGAVTNGELTESLRLIGDTATRIANVLRYAKRGNFHEAFAALAGSRLRSGARKKQVDVAADNWLELQYGFIPLYKDVKDAAQFMATTLNGTLEREYRVRYRKNETLLYDGPFAFPDAECYTRKQMIFTLRSVNTALLGGIADPASLVWELLPFSFVFDWWLPIGDYLHAAGFLNSIETVGEIVMSEKFLFDSGAPVYTGGDGGELLSDVSSYRMKRVHFSREVLPDFALPHPVLKPLISEKPWKHAASAVALLIAGRDSFSSDNTNRAVAPIFKRS